MKYSDFKRVENTIFEMLKERNYIISDSLKVNEEDFNEKSDTNIEYILSKRNKTKILVTLNFGDINIDIISKLSLKMKELEITNCILVYENITTPAKNAILLSSFNIQIFHFDELKINITKHELVPKHVKMLAEDIEILLDTYKIKLNQLPVILSTDPIVRFYDWKKGNVIKIIRKNGDIYYRCVV